MNPFLIHARTLARKLGLIGILKALLPARDYEERFHRALMEAIQPGDLVWDVGANVGYYSQLFAEKVGVDGRVVAFEPSPASAAKVRELVTRFPAIQVVPAAMSEQAGRAFFDVSSGEESVTNHLRGGTDAGAGEAIAVEVLTGDAFAASEGVPQVIKIDVEGFEIEVLRGLRATLADRNLRAVLCEVHFGVLESRGLGAAPLDMEKLLREADFKVRWVDASHLQATRG